MPFQSNFKANNTTSQKLQLTSEDLDRGSITKDFKIPHQSLRDCERFKEWERENYKFDESFRLFDNNGCVLADIAYKITTQSGEEYIGKSDENGYTQRIRTKNKEKLKIEILG